MASERERRHQLILSIIGRKPIRNQSELAGELQAAGVHLTQSTLSRELKVLGIGKAPDGRGGYRYVSGAGPEGALPPWSAFIRGVERTRNLIVVKTTPGTAQGVARGIDEADWADVMGTIAGDDTILVICRGDSRAEVVEDRVREMKKS